MIDSRKFAESGILLVDKPEDWTSHDVVNCVRRRFHLRKVGHCGTLDPMATGLLVVLLELATKLSGRLVNHDKAYSGVMRLGVETDSQDRTGEVVRRAAVDQVDEAAVRRAAAAFVGEQLQVPPMTSAVKIDGKKLYELARKGREVERPPRSIVIHDLEIAEVRLPDVEFLVHCSKGTYIRTLAADIGRELGCGAHVDRLRRLRSGPFQVEDAFSMEQIKQWEREDLFAAMIPLAKVADLLSPQ